MLDFLFPPECIICKAAGSDLCPSCLSGLEPAKPQNFEWITSLWNYRDPQVETLMRSLINDPADGKTRRYGYERLMSALRDLDDSGEAYGKPVVVFTNSN
jgi:hypothetical protein